MEPSDAIENRTFDGIAIGESANLTWALSKGDIAAVMFGMSSRLISTSPITASMFRQIISHGIWTSEHLFRSCSALGFPVQTRSSAWVRTYSFESRWESETRSRSPSLRKRSGRGRISSSSNVAASIKGDHRHGSRRGAHRQDPAPRVALREVQLRGHLEPIPTATSNAGRPLTRLIEIKVSAVWRCYTSRI